MSLGTDSRMPELSALEGRHVYRRSARRDGAVGDFLEGALQQLKYNNYKVTSSILNIVHESLKLKR
jgi:hypothetical protein